MVFYVVVSSALMALALYAQRRPELSLFLFRLCLPIIFVIAAWRFDVGCDYFTYIYHFDIQTPHAFADTLPTLDIGYWLLVDAASVLGLPQTSVTVVLTAIFFIGLYRLAKTQPAPMTILAIMFPILIFSIPMSAVRQAAAMGFIMLALVSFTKGQLIRYCLLVGAGFLFHSSAAIFLLIAPFIRFRINILNVLLLLPVVAFIALQLSSLEAAEIAADRYINTQRNDAQGATLRTLLLAITGTVFFLLISGHWRRNSPRDYDLVRLGAGVMIALFPLAFFIPTVADRVGYYFIAIQALTFAKLHYIRVPGASLILAGLLFGLLLFFIVWWQLSWQLPQCYEPYQNVALRALLGQD